MAKNELIAQQLMNALNVQKIWGGVLFNVLEYGARGDWHEDTGTNDTDAVQKTINEAVKAGSKLVFFPHGVTGVYRVDELTDADKVMFVGDNASFSGYEGTIMQFGDSGVTQDDIDAINARVDNIVGDAGSSNIEIVDARLPKTGPAYQTLKKRLDADYESLVNIVTAEQVARIAGDTSEQLARIAGDESLHNEVVAEGEARFSGDGAINARIDNLILESGGDSNLEVVDARINSKGVPFTTLKARLDSDAESADMADGSIMDAKLSNGPGQIKQRFKEYLDDAIQNKIMVPDYLKENLMVKADRIRKLQNENTFSIAYIPDMHHSSTLPSNGSKFFVLNALESEVDLKAYISAGDQLFSQGTSKQQATDNLADFMRRLDKKEKLLPAIGNHDNNRDGNDDRMLVPSEVHGLLYKQIEGRAVFDSSYKAGGYYYYDLNSHKVRIIVLNTLDLPYDLYENGKLKYTPNTTYAISEKQLKFVANKALNFTDKSDKNEWKVIIVSHTPMLNKIDLDPASPYITDTINKDILIGIVKAYRAGQNYTSTPTTGDFAQSISVNFTTQGPMGVLCFLFGHYHFDQIIKKDDFVHISSLPVHYFTDGMPGVPRTIGTPNEIAMDIITFDPSIGVIYLTRLGARNDRVVKTIAVKNTIQNGSFENGVIDWLGITVSSFTASNDEGVFTASAVQGGIRKEPYPITVVGHKYYIRANVKSTSNQVRLGAGTVSTYHSGSGIYELLDGVFEATSDEHGLRIFDQRASSWNAVSVKECMLIDLTDAFGLGKEPSQEQCRIIYDEYKRDTSVKKNLAPTASIQWEQGTFVPATGALAPDTTRIRHINPIIVQPNTGYTVSLQNFAGYSFVMYAYDNSNNFISSASLTTWQTANKVFTTPANCKYIRFGIRKVNDTTITNADINNAKLQLELGDVATPYEK